MTDSQISPARTKCIARWKVAGAFDSPNGISKNWSRPYRVRKAVFFLSPSAIGIRQYPEFISSVQNQRMPSKVSMHSSIRGNGYASLSVTEFSALKSIQNLQLLSRFLTSTGGGAHSETLGSMTLAANMASKCFFSSPSNPNGVHLIRWRMGNTPFRSWSSEPMW